MFTKQRFIKHAQLNYIVKKDAVQTTVRPFLPFIDAHVTFMDMNEGAVLVFYALPSGEVSVSSFYWKDKEYRCLRNHGTLPMSLV